MHAVAVLLGADVRGGERAGRRGEPSDPGGMVGVPVRLAPRAGHPDVVVGRGAPEVQGGRVDAERTEAAQLAGVEVEDRATQGEIAGAGRLGWLRGDWLGQPGLS